MGFSLRSAYRGLALQYDSQLRQHRRGPTTHAAPGYPRVSAQGRKRATAAAQRGKEFSGSPSISLRLLITFDIETRCHRAAAAALPILHHILL